jgi:pimeloyl-ACP methyl ester carboxylesterase
LTAARQVLFVQGAGSGTYDEWDCRMVDSLRRDLGARLPRGVPVRVFHGLRDETVPPAHADRYADAMPPARRYRLPGRDHQLDDDLGEVARVISRDIGPPR